MAKNNEVKKHPKVMEFCEKFPKRAMNTISDIKNYCLYRGISVDDLIESGIKEMGNFNKYLSDSSTVESLKSIEDRVSKVKQFLRFCGHDIPRMNKKLVKKTFFEDDPVVERFLYYGGQHPATKMGKKRALSAYCDFRGMTPAELVEEGKSANIEDLEFQVLKFYRTVIEPQKMKSGWKNYMTPLTLFYKKMCRQFIEFNTKDKGNGSKLLRNNITLDKEIMRNLLNGCDERDKMIILALWETGMDPYDLANLTVGDFKTLNIDNPDDITGAETITFIRQKTNTEFYKVFGKSSLIAMSKWLKVRRDGLIWTQEEITDETPIFTRKQYPFNALRSINYSEITKYRSKVCGYDILYLPRHFRNSYNTRLKSLEYSDRQMLISHSIGLDRHYDGSPEIYYKQLYESLYDEQFNLEVTDEAVDTLKEELEYYKRQTRELSEELGSVKIVVDKLWSAFNTSLDEQVDMKEQQDYEDSMRDDEEIKKEIMKKLKEEED